MKNVVKKFDQNLQGRDFVIGDLHGSYSCFENLLKNINFDPEKDRMFSVGDLVDRGPASDRCLGLIKEPWFHAVISNHEQMMIEMFRGGYMGRYWYQNGGSWAIEAVNDFRAKDRIPSDWSSEIIASVDLLEELPYLITVDNRNGKRFHIVHAELPFKVGDQALADSDLEDPDTVYELATTQTMDGDFFLWARYQFGAFYKASADRIPDIVDQFKKHRVELNQCPELSHVISGHTIMKQPLTYMNRTNIDTGAYLSYFKPAVQYGSAAVLPEEWAALTCIELDTWKFYQATESKFSQVEPYII